MADREKVICGLQAIYDEAYDRWVHTQYGGDKLVTLVSDVVPDALALLKEQEPVEPHRRCTAVYMNGACKFELMCGNCGISLPFGKPNYCPWCGRKVKMYGDS